MKRKYYIVIIILFSVGLITYINQNYFFNPLSFKEGNFTYLPFNWYKNPMTYSYVGYGKYEGLMGRDINNSEDIHFIYQELEKSEFIVDSIDTNIKENWIELFVRSNNKGIVLDLSWYSQTNICRVKSYKYGDEIRTVYIKITPELLKFFELKLLNKKI